MTACCCLYTCAGQQDMPQACQLPLHSLGTDSALQARALNGLQMQAYQLDYSPVPFCVI